MIITQTEREALRAAALVGKTVGGVTLWRLLETVETLETELGRRRRRPRRKRTATSAER